jgi:hypothetical protein
MELNRFNKALKEKSREILKSKPKLNYQPEIADMNIVSTRYLAGLRTVLF